MSRQPILSLQNGSMSGNASAPVPEKVHKGEEGSTFMRFLSDQETWLTFGPAAVGAALGGFTLYRNGAKSEWWNSLHKPTDKVHPWLQWCIFVGNSVAQAYSAYRATKALKAENAHLKKWIHISHMTSQALNAGVFMMMFGFHDLRWAFFLQIAGVVASLAQAFFCYRVERISFFISLANVVYNGVGLYWTYSLYSKNKAALGDDKASKSE